MGFCTQAQAGSGSLEMSSCDDCETAAMRRGEAGAMKPAAQHTAESSRVARSILERRRRRAESHSRAGERMHIQGRQPWQALSQVAGVASERSHV